MEDAILITNAYKRGTVVILDVKDYVEECERQINNTENYNRLQNGTTGANNELVHSVIKRFKTQKLFCKSIAEGLKINSPRNPRFYAQHKIYKKENPGIPVRSSITCRISKISEYVYYRLQANRLKHIDQTDSIICFIMKSLIPSSDFMSKLKTAETVLNDSYLVSLDVNIQSIQISQILTE